jgi:hypothetical protein
LNTNDLKVASSILVVNEAGQGGVWRDLHGEVHHSIEHIAEGAVHIAGRLHDSAILSHMGDEPVIVKGLGKARNANTGEGIQRQPTVHQAPLATDQEKPPWSLSRVAWQGSAGTNLTHRSCVEGSMKISVIVVMSTARSWRRN